MIGFYHWKTFQILKMQITKNLQNVVKTGFVETRPMCTLSFDIWGFTFFSSGELLLSLTELAHTLYLGLWIYFFSLADISDNHLNINLQL